MPTRDSVDKWSNRMDAENTIGRSRSSHAPWLGNVGASPGLAMSGTSTRIVILHPTSDAPALDSFGSELVRLLAGLILSTRQEGFLHA